MSDARDPGEPDGVDEAAEAAGATAPPGAQRAAERDREDEDLETPEEASDLLPDAEPTDGGAPLP